MQKFALILSSISFYYFSHLGFFFLFFTLEKQKFGAYIIIHVKCFLVQYVQNTRTFIGRTKIRKDTKKVIKHKNNREEVKKWAIMQIQVLS